MKKQLLIILTLCFSWLLMADEMPVPYVYYSFENNTLTNDTLIDDAGNTNAVIGGEAALVDDAERGTVMQTLNDADNISYASIIDGGLLNNTDEFTIAYWVKLNQAITWSAMFSAGEEAVKANHIYCTPNGWSQRCLTKVSLSGGAAMTTMLDQWINIAITKSSDGIYSWYENGELMASKAYAGNCFTEINADMFTIGALRRGTDAISYSTDGYFDDFKIYKSALSSTQIKESAGIPPLDVTAPIIEYQFNADNLGADTKGNADCVPSALATAFSDEERGDVLYIDNDGTTAGYASIDAAVLQDTFSISFWAKRLAGQSWEGMVGYSNAAKEGIYITPAAWNKYGVIADGAGDIWEHCLDGTAETFKNDIWQYCTVVMEGSNCNVYLDGEVKAASDIQQTISEIIPTNFVIGNDEQRKANSNSAFKGYIDDFKYYDYALNDQEVAFVGGFPWEHLGAGDTAEPDSINGILNKVEVYQNALQWFHLETNSNDYFGGDSMFVNNVDYVTAEDTIRGAVANMSSSISSYYEIKNFDFTDETFTFSTWVKLEAISTWQTIFALIDDRASGENNLYITPKGGEQLNSAFGVVGSRTDLDIWASVLADDALPTDVWKMITMTFNNGYVQLYLDGQLISSEDLGLSMEDLAANRAFVGYDPLRIKRGLDMLVDDIVIFDYVLPSSQIEDIYVGREPQRPSDFAKNVFEAENYVNGAWTEAQDGDVKYTTFTETTDDELKLGINSGAGILNVWAQVKATSDVIEPCLISITDKNGEAISAASISNDINTTNGWEWVLLYQTSNLGNDSYIFNILPYTSGVDFDKFIITADWGFDPNQEYNATSDIEAPTAPSGLTQVQVDNQSATLMWSPSTDNVGVVAYELFSEGKVIGIYEEYAGVQTLLASSEYDLSVRARDLAGNVSNLSSSITISTPDANFIIDASQRYKMINHFGSSDAWSGAHVGADWSEATKEEFAKLLFSRAEDKDGQPEGIGLSMWRMKIGDGSTESGLAADAWMKESECYMNEDGTYDWSKQVGAQYWLNKAYEYGVPHFTAWTDSPPYHMTRGGKTYISDNTKSYNLPADKYDDYAEYLAKVLKHFQDEGKPFDVISPINEPQWAWNDDHQSGSYATNVEMANVVKELNTALTDNDVTAKVMISEAGNLTSLISGTSNSSNQISAFWDSSSDTYVGDQTVLSNIVSGHSYWSNGSLDKAMDNRTNLDAKINAVDPDLEYWQTEYSLLGEEHVEGRETLTAIDYSLWLARIIHFDLTLANATGWSFWTTFNAGHYGDQDNRFGLINVTMNEDGSEGEHNISKNLWTLGQYSRFVRPGMTRISADASGVSSSGEATSQMASAYVNDSSIAIVLINYTDKAQKVSLNINGIEIGRLKPYRTSQTENMVPLDSVDLDEAYLLDSKSIVTLVGKISALPSDIHQREGDNNINVKCYPNPSTDYVIIEGESMIQSVSIVDLNGKLMRTSKVNNVKTILPLTTIETGTYIITIQSEHGTTAKLISVVK